jgi:hypothetical protein
MCPLIIVQIHVHIGIHSLLSKFLRIILIIVIVLGFNVLVIVSFLQYSLSIPFIIN